MRRETKTWAGRLAAAAVVVFVLAYVPYHVYVKSGLARTIVLRRDLATLRAHNQELAAENERLGREAEALRSDPAAIERVARDELGWVRAGEVVVDLSVKKVQSGTLEGFPGPPAMVRGEQSSPAPHARSSEVARQPRGSPGLTRRDPSPGGMGTLLGSP